MKDIEPTFDERLQLNEIRRAIADFLATNALVISYDTVEDQICFTQASNTEENGLITARFEVIEYEDVK